MTTQTLFRLARQRQQSLKLREAAENVLTFPFVALGWLIGWLWLLLRVVIALIVMGFERGARINHELPK
jgi:type II secretory pathway component PulF